MHTAAAPKAAIKSYTNIKEWINIIRDNGYDAVSINKDGLTERKDIENLDLTEFPITFIDLATEGVTHGDMETLKDMKTKGIAICEIHMSYAQEKMICMGHKNGKITGTAYANIEQDLDDLINASYKNPDIKGNLPSIEVIYDAPMPTR